MAPRKGFREHLGTQLKFLSRSAGVYDRGDRDEALRMAVPLRVLFHDTKSSTSLLTHLNAKTSVRLLSTAVKAAAPGGWAAITNLRIGLDPLTHEFVPKLRHSASKRSVPLEAWWSKEVIYCLNDMATATPVLTVTREDIVLWVADQDGGAHVDEDHRLKAEYLATMEGVGWSLTYYPESGPPQTGQFENAHLAALRQMTYEVLHSPALLALAA